MQSAISFLVFLEKLHQNCSKIKMVEPYKNTTFLAISDAKILRFEPIRVDAMDTQPQTLMYWRWFGCNVPLQ